MSSNNEPYPAVKELYLHDTMQIAFGADFLLIARKIGYIENRGNQLTKTQTKHILYLQAEIRCIPTLPNLHLSGMCRRRPWGAANGRIFSYRVILSGTHGLLS